MNIYECSCLPANLSPSGEFELCEVCRLEEENEDDNAAGRAIRRTAQQKEELMEISKEEITRMVQEAYIEGFNSALECLKSAKDSVIQTFAAQPRVQADGALPSITVVESNTKTGGASGGGLPRH